MLSINTHTLSTIAQRSLNNSTKLLNQAIERMSTGAKINHASDNAANYSISTNMGVRLSSYQVAEDNVSAGLNMLSTANGSLDLISDKLSRLRALAEQSANGTYGKQSLKAINSEANSIVDEIERIYSTAEYNGIKLFGELETKPEFIQEVVKRDTSAMTTLASVDENIAISSGTYSISTAEELVKLATMTNNEKIGSSCEFVLANDIDLSAYSTGEGWTPIGMYLVDSSDYSKTFQASFDGNGYVIKNLYINRPTENFQGLFGYVYGSSIKNVGLENVDVTGDIDVGGLVGLAKNGSTVSNSYATGSMNGTTSVGGLVGLAKDSSTVSNSYAIGSVTGDIDVGGLVGLAEGSSTITDSYYDKETSGQSDIGKGDGITTAEIKEKMIEAGLINPDGTPVFATRPFGFGTSNISNSIEFQVGIHSNAESQITLNIAFGFTNLDELRNIGLTDGDYFETIDNLLASISAKQTEYGACQNRLESALEEINTHYENLVSSRSTFRDADIGKVSSEYIRQQILQQASATLMATANQSASLALQLL